MNSLRGKMIFSLLLSYIVSLLIFGFFFYHFSQKLSFQRYYNEKNKWLSYVFKGMESKSHTPDDIKRVLTSRFIDQSPDFAFLIIYDEKGNRKSQMFLEKWVSEKYEKIDFTKTDDYFDNFFIFNKKVNGNNVVLAYDNNYLSRKLVKLFIFVMSLFSVFMLFIALFLSYFLKKTIIIPTLKITEHTSDIAAGTLREIELGIKGDDEIVSLAKSVNQMTTNLINNKKEITKRKSAQARLQNFLDQIFDNSPYGIITIDKNGIITNINQAALELLEIEFFDKLSLWEINPVFIQYKDIIDNVINERKVETLHKVRIHLDNKTLVTDFYIYPVSFDEKLGFAISIIDVSAQVSLERQLLQAQKMEAVGTLAGGIAHDFNNILNIIMGNTSLLKLKTTDKEMWRRIDIIDKSIIRASDLVKEILLFSRNESVDFKDVDLSRLVNNIILMGKEFFPRYIQLNYAVDNEDLFVYGDENQLSQVFLNILINARDAICESLNRDQGVINMSVKKLTVDSYTKKLYKKIKTDKCVEIRISDNGKGIEKTLLTKIFDPFFSTKLKQKGTGLGLSIVYKIVETHEGVIKVYSDVNMGTTFIVVLPLLEVDDEKKDDKKNNTLKIGHGKVMIVDDEVEILSVLREMLESLGYEVNAFESGHEAIEFYHDHHDEVDLVLLDIMMPKISGFKTFHHLKEIKDDVKVIFSSGYVDTSEIESLKARDTDVIILHKPFNIYELSSILYDNMSH